MGSRRYRCKALLSGNLVHLGSFDLSTFSAAAVSSQLWCLNSPSPSVSRGPPGTAQSAACTDACYGPRSGSLELTDIRTSWKRGASSGAHGGRRSGGACPNPEFGAPPFWPSSSGPCTCPRDKCTQVREGGHPWAGVGAVLGILCEG